MKSSTNQQQKSYQNGRIYYTCKEKFEDKNTKDKKYCKVRDYCHYTGEYRGPAHSIYNLKYTVHKKFYRFSQWI